MNRLTCEASVAPPSLPTIFNISAFGEEKFNISFNFGDGYSDEFVYGSKDNWSEGGALVLAELEDVSQIQVNHTFAKEGIYLVMVIAKSRTNILHQSLIAVVEDSVGEVYLSTDWPRVRPLPSMVTFVAKVNNGGVVSNFLWDFNDSNVDAFTYIFSNRTTSIASHQFTLPGIYNVKVTAKNARSFSTATLSEPLVLVEPIRNLTLYYTFQDDHSSVFEPDLGINEIDSVEFRAQVLFGSHLEFEFNYGDGSAETLATSKKFASRNHVYKSEGRFNVTLKVSNPLGSLTDVVSFFVCRKTFGPLGFNQTVAVILLGHETTFKVFSASNSNLFYDWWLDKKLLHHRTGPGIKLRLNEIGVFILTAKVVIDSNDSCLWKSMPSQDSLTIHVQDILQGVFLNIDKPNQRNGLVLNTDDKMMLRCRVLPSEKVVDYYIWNVGDQELQSTVPYLFHHFKEKGRLVIFVKALNRFSSVVSNYIEVTVIEKLKGLQKIRHLSSTKPNVSIAFHAHYWHGSNLTFLWNFGDGTGTVQTLVPHVKHYYRQNGVYDVTLFAWNQFSSSNKTSRVFVLQEDCQKPLISFPQSPLIIVQQGTPIYIEPDIRIDCEEQFLLLFQWKVYNENFELNISEQNHYTLILSKNMLHPGNYTVKIKVSVLNTILYEESKIALNVVRSPLLLSIIGGTSRAFNRNYSINLLSSIHREFSENLSYQWQCKIFSRYPILCFGKMNMDMNRPYLAFPGIWLQQSFSSYLFKLTVASNLIYRSASQFIDLKDTDEFDSVEIYCFGCKSDSLIVTQVSEISLKVKFSGIDLNNVSVEWQLWQVHQKEHLEASEKHCLAFDTTISYLNLTNIYELNSNISYNFGLNLESEQDDDLLVSPSQSLIIFDLKQRENNSSHGPHIFLEEGSPGDSGTASARNLGQIMHEADGHHINKTLSEKSSSVLTGLFPSQLSQIVTAVLYPQSNIPSIKHFYNQPRTLIELKESDAIYGMKNEHFLLKSNVLTPGTAYLATVNIKKTDSVDNKWMASQLIEVLSGPVNGRCFISPSEGKELITQFSLNCLEWMSDYPPLFYEIMYSIDSLESTIFLYHGTKQNIKFSLPAGKLHNDFNVNISVKIYDASGAFVVACDTIRKVTPFLTGKAAEQLVYNELFNTSSALSISFVLKNDFQTLQLLRILANILNREVISSSVKKLKMQNELLSKIYTLTRRTEFELLQIISFLNIITVKPYELNTTTLCHVLKLVHNLLKEWQDFNSIRDYYVEEQQIAVINTVGNFLQAILFQEFTSVNWRQEFIKIINSTGRIIQQICHLQYQKAFTWQTNYLTIIADCHCASDLKFKKMMSNSSCCQKHLLILPSNPFFKENDTRNAVVPLYFTTMHSYGEDICDDSDMTYHLKYPETSMVLPSFLLHHSEMNLHEFYLDETNFEHLFITITFYDVPDLNLLIKFVISNKNTPTSSNIFFQRIIRGEDYSKISFHIKKSELSGSGKYIIGILPTSVGNTLTGLSLINYTVHVWWTECLIWNWKSHSWVNSFCRVLNSSSLSETCCRCAVGNLLTSSQHFVNYNSSSIPLRNFYKNEKEQSSTLIVTAIFLVLFCILAIPCKMASIQDNQKCKIMYLEDNSPLHDQAYVVTITTGYQKGSGTTASIYIILHGENGMSETRELTGIENEFMPFQRNSQDTFIISTVESLGPIWKVQLWHDNKGKSPSWFLRNIIITDINTDNTFFFECNKWFAVEEDDGHIEREILRSTPQWHLIKVLNYFIPQSFSTFHIWYSLYSPWPFSDFTRLHRLVSCFNAIALNAAAAAFLLVNHQLNYENEVILFHWEVIWIGFIASIISKPFLIFIAFFFMKSLETEKIWCKFPLSAEEIKNEYHALHLDRFFPIAKKRKFHLSLLWKYVGWTASLAFLFIPLGFVNIIKINENSSLLWYEAIYFSWLFSFFFIESLHAFLMTLWFSWKARNNIINYILKSDHYLLLKLTWIIINQASTANILINWSEEEELIARCKSRYLRSLRPPPEYILIQERKKILKEKSVIHFLRNSLKYGLQIVLLIIVTFDFSAHVDNNCSKYIRQVLERSSNHFFKIKNTNDWWYWILHYGFSPLNEFNNFNENIDQNSQYFLIGAIRLQTILNRESFDMNKQICSSHYVNYSMSKNKSFHIIDLSYVKDKSLTIETYLKNLNNSNWLSSPCVKEVRFEFNVWNVALKTFSSVTMNSKVTDWGIISSTNIEISSVQKNIQLSSTYDKIALISKCLLLLILLWDSITLTQHFKANNLHHEKIIIGIKSLWILSLLAYTILNLNKDHEKLEFSKELTKAINQEFLNLTPYIRQKQFIHGFGGLLIFIAGSHYLFILMHLSTFSKTRYVMKNIITKVPLILIFLICLISTFLLPGIWCFGSYNNSFSSFSSTIFYLFAVISKLKYYTQIFGTFEVLYNFLFFITTIIFTFAWAKTILNSEWKQFYIDEISLKDLQNYVINKLNKVCCLPSVSIEKFSTKENPFFIEFHLQEMESQIDEMFFRMNQLCDDDMLNDIHYTSFCESNCDRYSIFHLKLMNWNNMADQQCENYSQFGDIIKDEHERLLLESELKLYDTFLDKNEDFHSSLTDSYCSGSLTNESTNNELTHLQFSPYNENKQMPFLTKEPLQICNQEIELNYLYEYPKKNLKHLNIIECEMQHSNSSLCGVRKQEFKRRPLRRTKSQGKGKGNTINLNFDSDDERNQNSVKHTEEYEKFV